MGDLPGANVVNAAINAAINLAENHGAIMEE
jgi:hypothetical protein